MPAQVCRLSEVAVPSQTDISARFRDLYPELLSRACRIADRERDPEETVQELLSFAWSNFSSAARRGKWLTPSQLSWVGMKRIRGEGCSLGSRRSKTDALAPGCRMRGRSKIVYLSTMNERRADDPCRRQFDEVIIQGQRDPGEQAITRLDWSALRHRLPGRLRRILDGLVAGESNGQIAKALGISAPRAFQLKQQLRTAISTFFGNALPTSLEGVR
jgi:hypothetical protein